MVPFLLKRRAAVALLLLIVSAVMAASALTLRVDPGVESLVPSTSGAGYLLKELNERFGSDEAIVLALRADPLFTAPRLALIDDLTRRAGRLPHVRRVLSPTNLRDLDGDELGPYASIPYEKVLSGARTPEALGQVLAAHPIFSGLLVASDARAAAILIEIEAEGKEDARAELVARVREMAAAAVSLPAGAGMEAWVAGLPVEKVVLAASVARDQATFAPIIFLMLAVLTGLLYRHPTGVIVPLGVVTISLIWTLGIYGMAGKTLNPITALLTPIVLVVSVAEAIHLVNHHLIARSEGLEKVAALERALRRARVPCFNAAATTAIGFASVAFMPIPAIRDFGLFTAAGVMIAYVHTMVLGPLLLGSLPDFPPQVSRRFRPGPVERAMKAGAGWVLRHPVTAGLLSAAVLVLAAVGVGRIRVETDIIRSLRPSSDLYRATTFVDRHLTGVNALEILARGVGPDDLEGLSRVERFERELRTLPGVRHVSSLPDLYARVHRAFHGGDDSFARLPDGPEAAEDLADARDLLEREAPEELARFAQPGAPGEPPVLRVTARVTAMDSASSQALFGKVREAAARAGLDRVDLTGSFAVLSDMSTSLVSNQVRGLVPALVLILGAMAVQFRSIRLGLLSALPNGAPVLMVYGLMGWAGIALSVPTAMIAAIAVGMTVDNTIHLLARFREEVEAGRGCEEALDVMLDTSGRAVVFSTVTVAMGFFVGVLSSFLPSVHFAVLTGTALLLGLACEAVLLPLALVLFHPLGRARRAAGIAAAIGIAAALAADPARAAAAPPVLKDQFGRPDGPGLHKGRVVLLLYGKSTGLRRMKSWELKILESAPREGLDVLRAVDARSVKGKKTEQEVHSRLREGVPGDVSILVDWEGEFVKSYAIPDGEVSVTILDPSGRSCGTTRGPAAPESLARVLDVLSRVREKGTCP